MMGGTGSNGSSKLWKLPPDTPVLKSGGGPVCVESRGYTSTQSTVSHQIQLAYQLLEEERQVVVRGLTRAERFEGLEEIVEGATVLG
jgi:hypothetical protein